MTPTGDRMEQSDHRSIQPFALRLTVIFGAVCALGMARHELWRDEMQIWMLARDSGSLLELAQHLRYETGHPFLWYLLLFGVSRVTRSPLALQVVHWTIAIASVYVLARFAPFSRLQKSLFAFSYFALYEYGMISRNYGLGMLLLFGACVLVRQRQQRYWPIALLLFLACNTNFYALIGAGAIAFTLALEWIGRAWQSGDWRQQRWDALGSGAIVLAGIGLYWLQLYPPADGGIRPEGVKAWDFGALVSAIALIWKSYVPIPWFTLNFWNTNWVAEGDAALLAIALVIGAIAVLIRTPLALVLYGTGTGAIVLIALLKHGGGVRHWGYAFVLWVVSLWLAPEFPTTTRKLPRFWTRLHGWLTQRRGIFFTGILILQVAAGLFAYGMDWVFPFSQAQATAQILQQRGLTQTTLIGDRDWAALTVSGWLDQPLFYPASEDTGTFIVWNNQRRDRSIPELMSLISQKLATDPRPLVLVLNYPLTAADQALLPVPLQELATVTGAIVADENYWLYQVSPRVPSGQF